MKDWNWVGRWVVLEGQGEGVVAKGGFMVGMSKVGCGTGRVHEQR